MNESMFDIADALQRVMDQSPWDLAGVLEAALAADDIGVLDELRELIELAWTEIAKDNGTESSRMDSCCLRHEER